MTITIIDKEKQEESILAQKETLEKEKLYIEEITSKYNEGLLILSEQIANRRELLKTFLNEKNEFILSDSNVIAKFIGFNGENIFYKEEGSLSETYCNIFAIKTLKKFRNINEVYKIINIGGYDYTLKGVGYEGININADKRNIENKIIEILDSRAFTENEYNQFANLLYKTSKLGVKIGRYISSDLEETINGNQNRYR